MLKEAQALLNDRPLLPMSEDSMDVITPSLLTRGRKLRPFPETFAKSQLKGMEDVKSRWQHRTSVMNHFNNVWRKQYRLSLQTRRKWNTRRPEVKIGDIVVLREAMTKRGYWPLARVVQINPGRDGTVRNLELMIPKQDAHGNPLPPTHLKRMVHEVCPLELASDQEEVVRLQKMHRTN